MRILITGGMGFIGTATAEALRNEHSVRVYDIKKGEDILDLVKLENAFKSLEPEIVFHLAARVSVVESLRMPSEYAETNILGTIAVADQCNKWGSKLIYASSGGTIYGGGTGVSFTEENPPNPQSPYGISKYAGELYVKNLNTNHVILRYGNVYGPGQSSEGESMVIAVFLERMTRGDKPIIRGDGLQTRDYVYITDVVDANLMAMQWDGTYNIGSSKSTSVIEVYKLLADATGFDDGYELAGSIGEIDHVSLSCEKANVMGWKAKVPIGDGIMKTVECVKMSL